MAKQFKIKINSVEMTSMYRLALWRRVPVVRATSSTLAGVAVGIKTDF